MDADETFRHTMQHINEGINLESLHAQLHQSDIPVQESEIQAYYQANQSQFGGKPLEEVRQQIRDKLASEREPNYVKNYIERLKANASITQDLALLDTPEPSEDDLRRYYDANREQFKLPARVVVDEIQVPLASDEAAARQRADRAAQVAIRSNFCPGIAGNHRHARSDRDHGGERHPRRRVDGCRTSTEHGRVE